MRRLEKALMRMEKLLKVLGVILLLCGVGACSSFRREAIRVACVGDNITFGHGIHQREQFSYPAQLEKILGHRYRVENYGVSGSTMLKSGDLPFWVQPEHEKALAFAPDIVVIMLGSNDSKPWNWEKAESFTRDYIALIREYKSLEPVPEILVCNPLPVYSSRFGVSDSIICAEIIPMIEAVASSESVQLVDFSGLFANRDDLVPDSGHLDSLRATLLATQIAKSIMTN